MTTARACVFGASGGIGQALVEALEMSGAFESIYACARKPRDRRSERIVPLAFDLGDEASIASAAREMGLAGPLDLVLVATGLLHDAGMAPEKSFSAIDPTAMARAFAVNAVGPALVAKHVLPIMRREGRAVFAALSARVGSICDNRSGGWHSYRASKAALNMLIRNFALEFARRNPLGVVVALHPGTVDTRLSRPYQRNVRADVLQSPIRSAGHLLDVLACLTPEHSGSVYAWDGEAIPC